MSPAAFVAVSECNFLANMTFKKSLGDAVDSCSGLESLFQAMTMLGMNPTEETKPWWLAYFIYGTLVKLVQLIMVPAGFILSFMLEVGLSTTSQLLSSVQVGINVCGLLLKLIAVIVFLPRLRRAEPFLRALDARCELPQEFSLLQRTVTVANRIQKSLATIYIAYSTVCYIRTLVLRQPAYSMYLPFLDWRQSHTQFYIQTFIEFLLVNLTCLHQSVCDGYTVTYIYILRTHVKIIAERVLRLGQSPQLPEVLSDVNKDNNYDENYEKLISCISDHQTLLKLLDVLNPVISVTIFVQFLITATLLGLTMINIFVFADASTLITCVIYIMAVVGQSTPCCYQATSLVCDAEQLPLAIFHCNWMFQNVRFRRMLVLFMLRAQKPMLLKAMKLFTINLATNLSIAKFSFSLYTFIKNMDFGQNLKN